MDRRVFYLSVARFIRVVGRMSTFIFLPIIFVNSYGLSLLETGVITASATAVMAVIQYFSGPWSDRFGRKFFLEVVPFFTAIAYMALFWAVGYSSNLGYMIIFWLSTMFLASLQFPAIQASVADLTASGDRLAGYTYVRVFANLGAAIGPMIGAFLAVYGFQWIFLIAGVTSALEGVLLYFAVGETFTGVRVKKVKGAKESSRFSMNPFLIMFTLAGILFGFAIRQTGPAFTLYIFDVRDISIISVGIIYSLNGLLVVLLQVPIFRLMNRKSNVMVWRALGTMIYGISFLLLVIFTGELAFLFIMGLITIGEDFSSPTTQTILMEVAPESLRGDYVGKYSFITSFGRIAGTIVGLGLLQYFYSEASIFWLIISILTFASSAWFFSMSASFLRITGKSQNIPES
ncbi:MAG: MFS transporter [Candidatus Thermoplasmatota archaeon]|jgi:MFS family permease|nr:MFS transporter [Candidatus Thermoplasmatota archaeon]MCL5791317.1 MFS transporter [Candidatus Thermoplasmatota archaeon]